MIISKQNTSQDLTISIDGTPLDRVDKLTYLGSSINDNWYQSSEIRIRIERAQVSFITMKKTLCNHNLTLSLRLGMVRCYVFRVFLYDVESWTLTDAMLKCLKAFELWVYRRLLKISWMDKVRNSNVSTSQNE